MDELPSIKDNGANLHEINTHEDLEASPKMKSGISTSIKPGSPPEESLIQIAGESPPVDIKPEISKSLIEVKLLPQEQAAQFFINDIEGYRSTTPQEYWAEGREGDSFINNYLQFLSPDEVPRFRALMSGGKVLDQEDIKWLTTISNKFEEASGGILESRLGECFPEERRVELTIWNQQLRSLCQQWGLPYYEKTVTYLLHNSLTGLGMYNVDGNGYLVLLGMTKNADLDMQRMPSVTKHETVHLYVEELTQRLNIGQLEKECLVEYIHAMLDAQLNGTTPNVVYRYDQSELLPFKQILNGLKGDLASSGLVKVLEEYGKKS